MSAPAASDLDGAAAQRSRPGLADLRQQAMGGAAWVVAGMAASNLLRLGGNVVLARLLYPEAFGVMALANVFMQGLTLFSDVGTSASIVRDPRGDDPAFLDTAWTLHAVRGVVLALLAAALAWPVASFYGAADPAALGLTHYLPALGLTALIDGAASTRLHRYGRHLRIRQLTLLEVHNQAVATVAMVVAAWLHPSVWALVLGALVRSTLRTGLSHTILEGPANRLRLDREALAALLTFGKWVLASTVILFLAGQIDRLILGRLLSLEELGVYGIALTLAMLPTNVLARVGNRILFPVLSRVADEGQQLREAARGRALFLGLGAIILTALLPNGPALIHLLYDARYQAAGWLLQLLLVGGWFQVLEGPNTALLLARGNSRAVASGNAVKLATTLLLLPLGFMTLGLGGAVLGLVTADLARYLVSAWLVTRAGLGVVRRDLAMTAAVVVASSAGVLLAEHAQGAGWAPWATLPLGAAGAVLLLALALPSLLPAIRERRRVAAAVS